MALMLMRSRTNAHANLSEAKVKTTTKVGTCGHTLPGEGPSRTSGRSTGSWNFGVQGAEGCEGPRCARGRRTIVRSVIDVRIQYSIHHPTSVFRSLEAWKACGCEEQLNMTPVNYWRTCECFMCCDTPQTLMAPCFRVLSSTLALLSHQVPLRTTSSAPSRTPILPWPAAPCFERTLEVPSSIQIDGLWRPRRRPHPC